MRYGYLSVLLLLLAIYPAAAGRCYDDPSFLTSHLVSGGVSKDGIPCSNQSHLRDTERNWLFGYIAEDDVMMGIVHQRRTASVPA